MKIIQSRSFAQRVKRFSKVQKPILDDQIRLIIDTPSIGVEKRGDLKGVFVHKFKVETLECLLAYHFDRDRLDLIMIGPHQNYYRDLKRYLKQG